jgi:hypothetical protein
MKPFRNALVQLSMTVIAAATQMGGCGVVNGDGSDQANNNANLAELYLSAGKLSPVFEPNSTSYDVTVDSLQGLIRVIPTAADPGATVRVQGAEVPPGTASDFIPLNEGVNIITVTVTATDGVAIKSYIIITRRLASINSDQEIRDVLKKTRITLDRTDETLASFVDYLRGYTGLDIYIDKMIPVNPDSEKITSKFNDFPLEGVLKLMLPQFDCTHYVENGTVVITKREEQE